LQGKNDAWDSTACDINSDSSWRFARVAS